MFDDTNVFWGISRNVTALRERDPPSAAMSAKERAV
jgi:hypothetical protein